MSLPGKVPTMAALSRREVLALGTAAFAVPSLGWAQDFPAKPIRLMVSSASGGGVDLAARIVAPRLGEELKTTMVVEVKAGASGLICGDYVAKSPPDGYTLMFCGGSTITIAPQLVQKPPFHPLNDFIAVNTIGGSPLVVSLYPGPGVRSLPEFLALAKSRPLRMASAGAGTLTHLTIELLSQITGGKMIHVPYRGGGPAVVDTLAGHVDGMISDIPPVLQHIQAGKLIPVAVTSDQRVALLPGVPTANEVLTGFTAVSWEGVFAPAKTPQAIIDRLSAALVKVSAQDEVSAQLNKLGVVPSSYPTPEAFRKYVTGEYNRWGQFIREKNITAPI